MFILIPACKRVFPMHAAWTQLQTAGLRLPCTRDSVFLYKFPSIEFTSSNPLVRSALCYFTYHPSFLSFLPSLFLTLNLSLFIPFFFPSFLPSSLPFLHASSVPWLFLPSILHCLIPSPPSFPPPLLPFIQSHLPF